MIKKFAPVFGAALAVTLGAAPAALADDRGNHEAIWKASQHTSYGAEEPCAGLMATSGKAWGELIGCMASDEQLKPNGVSEGVHLAKDHSVPGQQD